MIKTMAVLAAKIAKLAVNTDAINPIRNRYLTVRRDLDSISE